MIVVRDIMQTDVVSVTSDMTARQLARKLADEDISGAPVVGGDGALLGVASQTDLARLAAREQDIPLAPGAVHFHSARLFDEEDDAGAPDGFFLPEETAFSARDLLDGIPESRFDTMTVEEIMTPMSYSVPSDMPVPELADYLARGRIQRAVVVDGGRLVGIVTASDVLRAVADGRV